MTVRRVKWSVTGESLVREADDDTHAADAVEVAVRRAAEPLVNYGAEVESQSFHYAKESVTTEDG